MENTDSLYVDLQQHLDKQAVGFPATKSGVELRLLRELFTPEQAVLALQLSVEPRSAREVCDAVKETGFSLEKVANLLKEMTENGAIGQREIDNTDYYFTLPLLVGIVELHAGRATPRFIADFNAYMFEAFGRAFVSTRVSQMRTIPVEKSIDVEHRVTTYDHIKDIIENTEGPIVINQCMCREGAKRKGNPCKKTTREETCMGFGDWAARAVKAGARPLTKKEALEIMRQNEEDGLVLQPNNYQKVDFVCACCGCCCGILQMHKMMPKPAAIWAHNYYAAVDTETCSGCGTCLERCQVNAITLNGQSGYVTINLDRCIGCGNCVVTCPTESLKLVKMEQEIVPPVESIDLYKILAKKG
jgi:electron transport complex protein RnfB